MAKKIILFLFILTAISWFSCKTPQATFRPASLSPTNIKAFFRYSEKRPPLISAHRGGGYYAGYPENCVESFQYLIDSIPAIIECDVAMTRDSILVLMHDETLDRTTTGSGPIDQWYAVDLQPVFLLDHRGNTTPYKIPTLDQTLQWAKNKTILTLDIKPGVPLKKVVAAIREQQAAQNAMIITYTFSDSKRLYDLAPEIMQSVSIGSETSLEQFKKMGIPFSTVIAFTGIREPETTLYKSLHDTGVFCILGTLGNLDKKAMSRGDQIYRTFIENGADILATDRPFEAYQAIRTLIPARSKHYQYLAK